MSALPIALGLIRQFEGCRLAPYRDPVGIPTIGWGQTSWAGRPVTMQTPPITQAEADADLAEDVALRLAAVRGLLRQPATDGQLGAMVSFAYNVGLGNLGKSALLRLFNAGDVPGAAAEFGHWVYARGVRLPGLGDRRSKEREAFLDGTASRTVLVEESDADRLNAASLARARAG